METTTAAQLSRKHSQHLVELPHHSHTFEERGLEWQEAVEGALLAHEHTGPNEVTLTIHFVVSFDWDESVGIPGPLGAPAMGSIELEETVRIAVEGDAIVRVGEPAPAWALPSTRAPR